MTDWKGNEIKAGDTIVIVDTKPFLKDYGFLIPDMKGGFQIIKSGEQPPEHCWHTSEYKIREQEGKLYYGGEKDHKGVTYWF